ncbi:MAG: hypothetical protein JXA58_01905, partial [Dehalococcoidia bacterium]|nr:hypothetical protein [Dehalococcoidia bacterium]
GEYMAGGVLAVLGLSGLSAGKTRARFVGTGMHGGIIYLRGSVESHQLGKEVGVTGLVEEDKAQLAELVALYCQHFGGSASDILASDFIKLFPLYLRPYGRLYTG